MSRILRQSITRRAFLRVSLLWGLGGALAACSPSAGPTPPHATTETTVTATPTLAAPETPIATGTASPVSQSAATPSSTATPMPAPTSTSVDPAYLVVVRGEGPEALTQRAIAALGGMERFVRPGAQVVIKPNICNANHGPEYASTTNPVVVATLVKLCLAAGAKRVQVMDYPFSGTADVAYVRSGIAEAVEAAGGSMELMTPMGFVETPLPDGKSITTWPIYQPALEADLLINVPIAKHHSLARLTLAGKNLMGVVENRPQLHRDLGNRLTDLAQRLRPQLTVIDAVRILMANGPTGGNLNDVQQANTLIASHDMVAADAFATSLFGLRPQDISYIAASAERGLGTWDLAGVRVEELSL